MKAITHTAPDMTPEWHALMDDRVDQLRDTALTGVRDAYARQAAQDGPVCPDCGPLTLNTHGEITAHHCPTYSNLPTIDGYPHANNQSHETPATVITQEERPGYWERTGGLLVWQHARTRHGN